MRSFVKTLINKLTGGQAQMRRESKPVQPANLFQALDCSLAAGDYRRVEYKW